MTNDPMSLPIESTTECCNDSAAQGNSVPSTVESEDPCCSSTMPLDATAGSTTSDAAAAPSEVVAAATEVAEPAEGVPPDDAALIDALRTVIDPELMINIVDLGLVYSINHTDRKALVEMTLTSPACPAGPQIVSQAKMSLEKLDGIDSAEIRLTMSPPWTPDRMTDDARDQLGIF